jgi:hypothetical protein
VWFWSEVTISFILETIRFFRISIANSPQFWFVSELIINLHQNLREEMWYRDFKWKRSRPSINWFNISMSSYPGWVLSSQRFEFGFISNYQQRLPTSSHYRNHPNFTLTLAPFAYQFDVVHKTLISIEEIILSLIFAVVYRTVQYELIIKSGSEISPRFLI